MSLGADNLISFAESKRSVSKLAEVLEKNEGKPSAHYAFNQTHRWRIVVRAVAWKIVSADQLLEKEKARDNRYDIKSIILRYNSYNILVMSEIVWSVQPNFLDGTRRSNNVLGNDS